MDLQVQHDRDVAAISEQVKVFYQQKKHFRIYHGTTGSTRPMSFQPGTYVDTSKLNHTFPVDKIKHTIKVEPKVPMDELVKATVPHGYLPEVVPELKGLTVGGAFAGTAGESSSYRYGLFEETVSSIEIVLGNGSITTASPAFQPDLFEFAGSSMGTLGIVTLLEVKLIPYKPYVRLDFFLIHGLTEAMKKMEVACADPSVGYIDGMLFQKDFGVMMTGRLVDSPTEDKAKLHSFHRRNEPWFTNYVEDIGKKHRSLSSDPPPITMPVDDYFFRYDRGVFWGGKLGFDYFHMPFNRVTRWILDPLLGSRVAFHALHEAGFADRYIVQDYSMPCTMAAGFMDYISTVLPDYQFYLCPAKTGTDLKIMNKLKSPANDPAKRKIISDNRIFNIGVYGKGPTNPDQFVKLNREIEHRLWDEFCGVKMLYARSYYTEDEFQAIYNREPYDIVRAKYHAENLPNVYDKITADMRSGRKPPRYFAGYRGAAKAALALVSKRRAAQGFLIEKKKAQKKEEAEKLSNGAGTEKKINGVGQATGANGTNGVNGVNGVNGTHKA